MAAEPIRSVLYTTSTDDTSLVLPTDRRQRTGEQRVREQVQTIRRSRKQDSVSTPTPPSSTNEFSEPKFQFSPTKLNTLFRFSGSGMTATRNRAQNRSLSVRNTVKHQSLSSQWNVQSNGIKLSGSEPSLNKTTGTTTHNSSQFNHTKTQSLKQQKSQVVVTNQSETMAKTTNQTSTKTKTEASGVNGGVPAIPDITLQEAVEYLTHSDISYQLCGASFIQHNTFIEDSSKQEVCRLGGIPHLIQLLKMDNSQLQQTAAAALRNVVFKDKRNKLEVERCGGLEVILTSLRNTSVVETQKQLTGLLWNLSSADELKPELIRNAMELLTEGIVVPYNFWGEDDKHIDPEVFYNTTGCLRNLSCAKENERTAMRCCPKLIDSLVTCIQTQVERGEPDDKSVENCVCILHNLSFQLEKEASDHFKQFVDIDEANTSKKRLFSPKSKIPKELSFPSMEEANPEGVNWLYHRKTLQLYLKLLGFSQKEATLEACCGALQNLTASKSSVSTTMSQTIIQKLQGLPVISPLLKSGSPGLQKTAMSLVGNMSRVSSLRETMAKEVLPSVSSVLSTMTPNMLEKDTTLATACRVMHTLVLAEPDTGRKLVNQKLVDSLSQLSSNNSFKTASKDAAVLLWSMWGKKEIQSTLKKQGMSKSTFINDVTAAAYKEATVTESNGH
ncbi:hypothetical protein DNTS_000381 [Danionella cerebrum]|uniref:Plakophilin-1 n=1 Tax=Danionella cerebrum TaxID=2873325 RepID=A0A553PWX2_9TELE|nr:hypothetical protein DNTS_000381 [Danionella translucida]